MASTKLPPHAPVKRETSKTLLITFIALAGIGILGLLWVAVDQFVGKAYTGEVDNTAGIEDGTVAPSLPFSVPIMVNLGAGKSTVALGFRLQLPVVCNAITFTDTLAIDWGEPVLETYTCSDSGTDGNAHGSIYYERAIIDWEKAKSGEFEVGKVNFASGLPTGGYLFDFEAFQVVDLETSATVISSGEDGTITVREEACPSADWSNVCCILTDVQFSNFIVAQLDESTGYTDIEFSNFIVAQLDEAPLCE